MRRLPQALMLMAAMAGQTPPQERDIKFKPDLTRPAPAAPVEGTLKIPRSYALIVGVSAYANIPQEQHLQFSERDAEAIYSILISPEGGNFRAENVHKLIGPRATLANLKYELEEWLPSVAGDEDRVLIYYAGHGFYRDGRAYLAPYDIRMESIPQTGYPMQQLGRVFSAQIRGKHKILLTDSCHSGAITPAADAELIHRQLLDLSKSLFLLTASRDRERSFESPEWGGGHGIFTYYVVRGLEGYADESGDGVVTADELADYVRRNVREATGGQQNPTSDRGSFDAEMLLSYLPSGGKPGEPPPPKFGTLLIESNMDGVEVFVNGKSIGVAGTGAPLRLPGLPPGVVTVKGVKMGYEPDGPREEVVYPGQESTVSIRIVIPRRRAQAAARKFDEGLEQYNKGTAGAYRKAASRFLEALRIDPNYSQAALYAGRAYDALYEQQTAAAYFRKAIEIDPDYLEARASYGGMLLGIGDVDEAIRQFNWVTRRDPANQLAYYLQAQAYRLKGMYEDSIRSAGKAIALAPNNAEAHFWLAESLRMTRQTRESNREYETYLRLSDFDSKFAGRLHYYLIGSLAGMGSKKRASQQDIWREMRGLAYFGLCQNAKDAKDFQQAIGHCRQALRYDPDDPYTHYLLGLCYGYEAENTGSLELLAAARRSFRSMLTLNPDLKEAAFARRNLASIEETLRDPRN